MPATARPPSEVPAERDDRTLSPGTDRTLAILELLAGQRSGLSISEIARELQLPVNSVFRITNTLLKRAYLERREADKRFVLSGRLLELAQPTIGEKSLVSCALEPLRRLRDGTGETAQLLAASDHKSVVLEQFMSKQPIKVTGSIGFRVPLYSCAPGKAILAHLPSEELEGFFASVTLKSFTRATLSTRALLEADLSKIRSRGYALDLAEGNEGIHCVGAVILDARDYPVGGITVIGPSFRIKRDRFHEVGDACIRAAADIRKALLS
jgi:IclR family acetate operon transcriptional repressor